MRQLRYLFSSLIYRLIRRAVIFITQSFQCIFQRPRQLQDAEFIGDALCDGIQTVSGPIFFNYAVPDNLKTDLYELTFPSPLTFHHLKPMFQRYPWLSLGIAGN